MHIPERGKDHPHSSYRSRILDKDPPIIQKRIWKYQLIVKNNFKKKY